MSKRKPIDKAQARERRNRMLDAAAKAQLSLTEGVREMRAIAGMTQEEFARHRGVSARVIKAIELGQGNPTVATLNQIGQFFGLEVAFVPVNQTVSATVQLKTENIEEGSPSLIPDTYFKKPGEAWSIADIRATLMKSMSEALNVLNQLSDTEPDNQAVKGKTVSPSENPVTGNALTQKKKRRAP